MSYVDQTIDEISGRNRKSIAGWSAELLNSVAAIGDELFVRIPGINPDGRRGPCQWQPMPRVGGIWIPGGGELALVTFDDAKQPWVSMWIPDENSQAL